MKLHFDPQFLFEAASLSCLRQRKFPRRFHWSLKRHITEAFTSQHPRTAATCGRVHKLPFTPGKNTLGLCTHLLTAMLLHTRSCSPPRTLPRTSGSLTCVTAKTPVRILSALEEALLGLTNALARHRHERNKTTLSRSRVPVTGSEHKRRRRRSHGAARIFSVVVFAEERSEWVLHYYWVPLQGSKIKNAKLP